MRKSDTRKGLLQEYWTMFNGDSPEGHGMYSVAFWLKDSAKWAQDHALARGAQLNQKGILESPFDLVTSSILYGVASIAR